MAVVVRGATVAAIPKATTTTAGKNVVQYEPPMPGRAYSARPTAAIAGPTVSGRRLPVRATSAPDHRDSTNMMIGKRAAATLQRPSPSSAGPE
jgi:hypothetical protein